MIYIIFGIILISLIYVDISNFSRKSSIFILFLSLLFLLLLAAFRFRVGADWDSYINFYENIEESESLEIGYAFLNNFFSSISLPYNLFLLFINGFALYLMFIFIRNNTKYMQLAVLLFFCDLYLYYNLSGIRQAIALAITCYSITFVLKRQFFAFTIAVLFASTFHVSALIFIIAYFVPKKIPRYTHIIFFSIILSVIYYNKFLISDFITINNFKNLNYYILHQEVLPSFGDYIFGIFKRSIIIIIILLYYYNFVKKDINCLFLNLYIIGFIIYLISYNISPDIGVRLSSYFIIFEIVLLGKLLSEVSGSLERIAIITTYVSIAIYKIFSYINNDAYKYQSILSNIL